MEAMTYHRMKPRTTGFRLNSRRSFTVSKLRAKFLCLFTILTRWRRFYSRTLRSLNKARRCRTSKPSRSAAAADRGECRLTSFRRSNSFYAQAIADCLDFIKRSSVSSGDRSPGQPTLQFLHPSSTT